MRPPGGAALTRTAFLHVGVAKTGTTYLQRILYSRREQLKAHGVLYPGDGPADQYMGSLDLRGESEGIYADRPVAGSWDTIVAEVRGCASDVVISHETLARCTPAQIQRLLDSFPGMEFRVVLTVRDLGRQIPAVWQEMLKNRQTMGYAEFLRHVLGEAKTQTNK
ncbi:MAG: hypothetical protein ACRDQ1_19980 [Sciscionella sp.]